MLRRRRYVCRDEIVDSPTDPDDNAKRRGIGARRRVRRSQRVAKRGFFSKLKSWAAKVTKVSQSKTDKRKFELQDSFTIFNQTKDCGGRSQRFPRNAPGADESSAVSASLQASVTARAGKSCSSLWTARELMIPVSIQHAVWLLRGRHARPAQGQPGLCLFQSVASAPVRRAAA